jgi:hypothetical protein
MIPLCDFELREGTKLIEPLLSMNLTVNRPQQFEQFYMYHTYASIFNVCMSLGTRYGNHS